MIVFNILTDFRAFVPAFEIDLSAVREGHVDIHFATKKTEVHAVVSVNYLKLWALQVIERQLC